MTQRRIPTWIAADLADVEARLDEVSAPVVMIFDVDNTLAPQGAPHDQVGAVVNEVTDRFEAHPMVKRVVMLTNGAQRGVARMTARGNKPWTSRRRLALRRGETVWVIGDQVLTDGLLAWRLRATFVQLAITHEGESWDQAMMRRIGRLPGRLLLRHVAS